MPGAADEYLTLMASLPALGPLLAARRPPINRVRLEARMKMLKPEHRAELLRLESLLAWRALPLETTDAEQVARARALIPALSRPALRGAAQDRMELRTVLAALRRRAAGEDAPREADWGYGRHARAIAANWREPDFGLARAYPWLREAQEMLAKGESASLERLILGVVWEGLSRRALGHFFDYEAVALYALRWRLVERWTAYDAQHAAARFRALTAAALAAAPDPFAGDSTKKGLAA
jgi:hypothetical protein